MKEELHQRLWAAQERWFELRQTGVTKHDLKMAGLRERGDMYWATRQLIFTGNTRVTYERVLKRFVGFCQERGIERNADITKREMRAYVDHLIEEGAAESTLDKVRSACVKFGALYGKYESFHSVSEKVGAEIRDLVEDGVIHGPEHQRITPKVAARAIERLRELDERAEVETGLPRAYALAAELQRRCGLRAIEATERLTSDRVRDGHVVVLGKGGRERSRPLPGGLGDHLRRHFEATGAPRLAPLRAYETAWRRAVVDVGGRSTGTHALRRLWADHLKNERYGAYVRSGMTAVDAADTATADTLEALGHGRDRWELRRAYLRAA